MRSRITTVCLCLLLLAITSLSQDVRKIKSDFIRMVRPFAIEASNKSGISADFMISQAALETGWGRFVRADVASGRTSNNFFNIKKKSTDDCEYVTIITHEYLTNSQIKYMRSIGKTITVEAEVCGQLYCSVLDNFRAYPSPRESFLDYANYISHSPRYSGAMRVKNSVPDFANELKAAGYATDPRYAWLITKIWQDNLR